jgi:hypothetical protein
MGPLELQLNRELAIQMVRLCAQQLRQEEGEAQMDEAQRRQWFDVMYADWMSTPKEELGGLTPAEAIDDERTRLPWPEANKPGATQHVELYTDLPQAEDVSERIELADHELVSPAADRLATPEGGAERAEPEAAAPPAALDAARWLAFYDRYLADWAEE